MNSLDDIFSVEHKSKNKYEIYNPEGTRLDSNGVVENRVKKALEEYGYKFVTIEGTTTRKTRKKVFGIKPEKIRKVDDLYIITFSDLKKSELEKKMKLFCKTVNTETGLEYDSMNIDGLVGCTFDKKIFGHIMYKIRNGDELNE